MTKLEEVARAIHKKRNGDGCKPWGRLPIAHKQPYMDDARAALSALREPSPEMILAATSRSDNGDRPTMYHSIWQAMIEKAMEG